MKSSTLMIALCFLLLSCANQSYTVSLPAQVNSQSYTLWYHDAEMTLPLLAGFEQNQDAGEGAQLGLIFLQGKRFAQCTYKNSTLSCNIDPSINSSKMHKIALNIAQIIAHKISKQNPLPLYWEKDIAKHDQSIFYNTKENSKLSIKD